MGIVAILLVVIGLYFAVKSSITELKERRRKKTEGERMLNRYVLQHEKKLADDHAYAEYLEWCKFHAELPLDKDQFEVFRKNEENFENKLRKALE